MSGRPRPAPIDPALALRAEEPSGFADREGWWGELNRLDLAVYGAIAITPTPTLDRVFRRLSRAADHSKLWIASAAVLATVGGAGGRRAAVNGLASIAVTSAVVNLLLKPLGRRHRPHRATYHVPITRQVAMPRTASFPSGHAASASAFATGVATAWPEAGLPLSAAAALVAYSRVHTGVHYPLDVIAGSLTRATLAQLTAAALSRRHGRRPNDGTQPAVTTYRPKRAVS
jgi:membrane-associated phospholipid phosphatase